MATIFPSLGDQNAFGPNDIVALSKALDDVCKLLMLPDGSAREVGGTHR